jgi:hypothetical protein
MREVVQHAAGSRHRYWGGSRYRNAVPERRQCLFGDESCVYMLRCPTLRMQRSICSPMERQLSLSAAAFSPEAPTTAAEG